jgi:hypothetical protein
MNRSLSFLLLLILLMVVGCKGGDRQIYANVTGTVKFNGKLIDKGEITFALEGRPPSTMDIIDGKFSGQAMVGSNKVMVSAKKKGTAPQQLDEHAKTQIAGYMKWAKKGEFGGPPSDYDPTMVEYIPAQWNTDSKQMRVVEAGAANDFQFDIRAGS